MSSGVVKENYPAILESNSKLKLSSSFIKNENNYFIDQFLRKEKKTYLELLKKNRSIFLNYKDLTNKQKIDFYTLERYLMKLYLKEVLLKLTKG
jgi:adenine-specific DNA methylase